MDRLLNYLLKRGFKRGLLGGESLWLALGGLALVLRLARKATKAKPEVVFSEKLSVGEGLVISQAPRKGHNGRNEGAAP